MSPLFAALALQAGQPAPPSPAEIVAAAPAAAWEDISADALLLIDLPGGRRVAVQLAPERFAPVHLANIRALARAGWWNGTSINRVQDNYVVQWGDATEAKPLPPGIVARPPEEYEVDAAMMPLRRLASPDAHADMVGFSAGWPVAVKNGKASLPHCYAMVGAGRNLAPDTGTGAELYTVIGHAPRHLDRNIAVVGRIVAGMEHLSALPRGTQALGFYRTQAERVPIVRAMLAADLPDGQRPRYQAMRTDSAAFGAYLEARANRRDPFFNRPAGGVDICNAPVPVRPQP